MTKLQTIVGDEINQSRKDEEEISELLELAKLVNIFLTMATATPAKKSSLVWYDHSPPLKSF